LRVFQARVAIKSCAGAKPQRCRFRGPEYPLLGVDDQDFVGKTSVTIVEGLSL
jgi:hypothetical protein